jgi:putative Holliday junction resolvase
VRRYLGIDYGAKRVGLARADDDGRLAQPFKTVPPAELVPTIQQEGPFDVLVVGWPRNLDGAETPQSLAVRRFADDRLSNLGAEVAFQDEAGTSSVARERLEASGKKYKPEQIDAEAASIILQDYLDNL